MSFEPAGASAGVSEVRSLRGRGERIAVAHALADAFHEAANLVATHPNPTVRARSLPPFFTALLRDAAPFGAVDLGWRGERLAGVAVWQPPSAHPMSTTRQLRMLPSMMRVLAHDVRSFGRLARLGARLQAQRPREAHWYLAALGVPRAFHGHGLGTLLLEHGLARADEAGEPCHLETFSERHVGFYRRFGFEVAERVDELLPGGPTFWFMWRPTP